MTLSELRALVILNLGGRDDKDDLIDAAINAGLRQSAQRYVFKSLTFGADLTLTIGVSAVALPATAKQIVELRLINGLNSYPLNLVSKTLATQWLANPSALSNRYPCFAYEEAGTLYVVPLPSQAFVVRGTYIKLPATLALDADEPDVDGLDNALVAYGTSHVYRSLQMYPDAQAWDAQFEKELASAIVADKRKPAMVWKLEQHSSRGSVPAVYGDVFAGHHTRR